MSKTEKTSPESKVPTSNSSDVIPEFEYNRGKNPEAPGPYWVKRIHSDSSYEMMYWTGSNWKTGGQKVIRAFPPNEILEWMEFPFYSYENRIPAEDRVRLATRTEAPVNPEMIARFSNPKTIRILHAVMGLCTEVAGEMMDNLKKHLFYGKPIDELNMKEELGDADWYMNLLCDVLNTTMQMVEVANVKKLAQRYGEKFSKDGALLRNLGAELMILEKNLNHPTTVPTEHREHGNIQS